MTELNPYISVITINVIGLNSHTKHQTGFKTELHVANKEETYLNQ